VALLRRNVYERRSARSLRRIDRRRRAMSSFSSWTSHMLKRTRQADLCTAIGAFNTTSRLFRQWRDFLRDKFSVRRSVVGQWRSRRALRVTWSLWTGQCIDRRYLRRLQRHLSTSTTRRVFKAWRAVALAAKLEARRTHWLRCQRLAAIFNRWKGKVCLSVWLFLIHYLLMSLFNGFMFVCDQFQRRDLLRRVFMLREQAWFARRGVSMLGFHAVHNIFTAWARLAQQRRERQRDQRRQHLALCFRGATLLARSFLGWRAATRHTQQTRLLTVRVAHSVLAGLFQRWSTAAGELRRADEACAHAVTALRLKRALAVWQRMTERRASASSRASLRDVFDRLKQVRRLARLARLTQSGSRVRQLVWSWQQWRRKAVARWGFARGLTLLAARWTAGLLRLALLKWPGYMSLQRLKVRLQDREAREQALDSAGQWTASKRSGVRLVDANCDDNALLPQRRQIGRSENDEGSDKLRSFIKKREPTLREIAVRRGLMFSVYDADEAHKLLSLVQAVLLHWTLFLQQERRLRSCSTILHASRQRRLYQRSLLKWVSLTPCISHRVITWLHNKKQSLLGQSRDINNIEQTFEDSLIAMVIKNSREVIPGEVCVVLSDCLPSLVALFVSPLIAS
jgi:hypothetical protein